jgi:hypothetical protein
LRPWNQARGNPIGKDTQPRLDTDYLPRPDLGRIPKVPRFFARERRDGPIVIAEYNGERTEAL